VQSMIDCMLGDDRNRPPRIVLLVRNVVFFFSGKRNMMTEELEKEKDKCLSKTYRRIPAFPHSALAV
jgi:hypothetical protein